MTPLQHKIIEAYRTKQKSGIHRSLVEMAAELGCTQSYVSKVISVYNHRQKEAEPVKSVEAICPRCRNKHTVYMDYADIVKPRIYCPSCRAMAGNVCDHNIVDCGVDVRRDFNF